MLTRLHRAALGAAFPFVLATAAARAQPKVQANPFAKQPLASAPQTQINLFAKPSDTHSLRRDPLNAPSGEQPADAFFGDIEIDQSRAQNWADLIDGKRLKKQIADLDGTLSYREGALGFYRVGYEAIGTRNDGTVRVTVTIVGQSGDRTILATGQSVQRWRDGVFLYEKPSFNRRTPEPSDNQFGAKGPLILKPTSYGSSVNSRFARWLFCAPDPNPKRNKDKDDDKPRRAPDPQPKIDSSRAPDPTPPKREPERKPEPQRAPDPTPPRREERPEPPRAPDPFPPDESQRPLPPISPPILRAPDPNPPARGGSSAPDPNPPYRGGSSAPDPNPPYRGGSAAPNPNPPSRGGVHSESRPPRRPRWNDPYYGRYPYPDSYPYPYPAPYPYPYPYPVPYPAPYPAPFPYPYPDPTTIYGAREGARQAFDYALVQARVDAETDFDRQLWGKDTRESLVQNQW